MNSKTKIIIIGVMMSLTLGSVVLANDNLQSLNTIQSYSYVSSVNQGSPNLENYTISNKKDNDSVQPISRSIMPQMNAEEVYKLAELAEQSQAAKLTRPADWQIAELAMKGEYGEGPEMKNQIEKEGYDYIKIKRLIEEMTPKQEDVKPPNLNEEKDPEKIETIPTEPTKENIIKAYPHREFKSYMSWKALSPKSTQGKFSAKATPDPETAIMMYNGRYLVALGFAYADEVGQEIDIVMESGQVIPAVIGDFKAEEHTDKYNSTQRWDGSIVEFVVSDNKEAAEATNGTGSYNNIFPGLVKEFRK